MSKISDADVGMMVEQIHGYAENPSEYTFEQLQDLLVAFHSAAFTLEKEAQSRLEDSPWYTGQRNADMYVYSLDEAMSWFLSHSSGFVTCVKGIKKKMCSSYTEAKIFYIEE